MSIINLLSCINSLEDRRVSDYNKLLKFHKIKGYSKLKKQGKKDLLKKYYNDKIDEKIKKDKNRCVNEINCQGRGGSKFLDILTTNNLKPSQVKEISSTFFSKPFTNKSCCPKIYWEYNEFMNAYYTKQISKDIIGEDLSDLLGSFLKRRHL